MSEADTPGVPKGPVERLASVEEEARVFQHALLLGADRALGLRPRVLEMLKERGWSTHDHLVAVISAALALTRMEEVLSPQAVAFGWAGRPDDPQKSRQVFFRRPPMADECGGKWPTEVERVTPRKLVKMLDLDDLLVPR